MRVTLDFSKIRTKPRLKKGLWPNRLPIGRFPSKHCVTTFQNNLFLTCQRLNIWLFSYHFALMSVLQQWLLCQPTLFTKNQPNIGNIFACDQMNARPIKE